MYTTDPCGIFGKVQIPFLPGAPDGFVGRGTLSLSSPSSKKKMESLTTKNTPALPSCRFGWHHGIPKTPPRQSLDTYLSLQFFYWKQFNCLQLNSDLKNYEVPASILLLKDCAPNNKSILCPISINKKDDKRGQNASGDQWRVLAQNKLTH